MSNIVIKTNSNVPPSTHTVHTITGTSGADTITIYPAVTDSLFINGMGGGDIIDIYSAAPISNSFVTDTVEYFANDVAYVGLPNISRGGISSNFDVLDVVGSGQSIDLKGSDLVTSFVTTLIGHHATIPFVTGFSELDLTNGGNNLTTATHTVNIDALGVAIFTAGVTNDLTHTSGTMIINAGQDDTINIMGMGWTQHTAPVILNGVTYIDYTQTLSVSTFFGTFKEPVTLLVEDRAPFANPYTNSVSAPGSVTGNLSFGDVVATDKVTVTNVTFNGISEPIGTAFPISDGDSITVTSAGVVTDNTAHLSQSVVANTVDHLVYTVTDAFGLTAHNTIDITVTPNDALTGINWTEGTIGLDTAGAIVGTFIPQGGNPNEKYTYTATDANGDSFTVTPSTTQQPFGLETVTLTNALSSFPTNLELNIKATPMDETQQAVTVMNEPYTLLLTSGIDHNPVNVPVVAGSGSNTITITSPDPTDSLMSSALITNILDGAHVSVTAIAGEPMSVMVTLSNYTPPLTQVAPLSDTITVTLTDIHGIHIPVNDTFILAPNDMPTGVGISLDNYNITNDTTDAVIGNLSVTNGNPNETYSFSLTSDASNADYTINGNELELSGPLPAGAIPQPIILVTPNDDSGEKQSFSLPMPITMDFTTMTTTTPLVGGHTETVIPTISSPDPSDIVTALSNILFVPPIDGTTASAPTFSGNSEQFTLSDGDVVTFMLNSGQITDDATNAIAAGTDSFSFTVTDNHGQTATDQTVTFDETAPAAPLFYYIGVDAGFFDGYAISNAGNVFAWGEGFNDALGNGTSSPSNIPTPAEVVGVGGSGDLQNIIEVSALSRTAYALDSTGHVYAWGDGGDGALGNNGTANSSSPIEVHGVGNSGFLGDINPIVQVAAGYLEGFAVDSMGNVYAWGYGSDGGLGDGSNSNQLIPVPLTSLSNIVEVAASGDPHPSAYALSNTGVVYAWGYGGDGELGNGGTGNSDVPITVSGLPTIVEISAGIDNGFALSNDGHVYAWGFGGQGELGQNSTSSSLVPIEVEGPGGSGELSNIVQIAAGDQTEYALDNNGDVYAWGYNGQGEAGTGNTSSHILTPTLLTDLHNIVAISASSDSTYALDNTGNIYAWGFGGDGEIGNGTSTGSNPTPTLISGSAAAQDIVSSNINLVNLVGESGNIIGTNETLPAIDFSNPSQDYLVLRIDNAAFNDLGGNLSPTNLDSIALFSTNGSNTTITFHDISMSNITLNNIVLHSFQDFMAGHLIAQHVVG